MAPCVARPYGPPGRTVLHLVPLDRVNRQFAAQRPNQLWVSGFTYVSTWQGFVYVGFVIDVFARCIAGWRVSRSVHTEFVFDALEQALWARQPERDALIHHSDRGSQYVSIRCSERLADPGIELSKPGAIQLVYVFRAAYTCQGAQ